MHSALWLSARQPLHRRYLRKTLVRIVYEHVGFPRLLHLRSCCELTDESLSSRARDCVAAIASLTFCSFTLINVSISTTITLAHIHTHIADALSSEILHTQHEMTTPTVSTVLFYALVYIIRTQYQSTNSLQNQIYMLKICWVVDGEKWQNRIAIIWIKFVQLNGNYGRCVWGWGCIECRTSSST